MAIRSGIDMARAAALMASEREAFARANPQSAALAAEARKSFYSGVPMHWMADWSTPFPLFVDHAKGASFTDVDSHRYTDFCLGDTGTMFGHAPDAVANAIRAQSERGYTTMLPSADAPWVGAELSRRFGLDIWQVTTTATDANRAAIRWARAVTERDVILVFDGCYHGAVDDTMVRIRDGETVMRSGLLGQVYDVTAHTRVVPFNDLAALEAALAPSDVAAVLCEPAMTNIGMVLPNEGFHDALRAMTRARGTLLIIDETHTISTGTGGYTRAFGLEPDMFVIGKPIAGGIPAAVYGATAEVGKRMAAAHAKARQNSAHGHSGIGTTLSANALQLACMRACLGEVITDAAYAYMIPLAERLAAGLRDVITAHGLPWSVTQIGARVEFQFTDTPPRTGAEAEAGFNDDLEACIHLYLINRGIMITPFHNMMLVCPATTAEDVELLIATFALCVRALLGN